MKGLFLALVVSMLAVSLYAGDVPAVGEEGTLGGPVAIVAPVPVPTPEPADATDKTAEEWLAEGRELWWYEDRFEEASVAFTNAIERDPTLVRAYNLRAWMYYMLDRYDEALADYATIIHMDSVESDDLLEALEERGNLLNRMGLYAEAVADYTAAIAVAPEKQSNYTAREQALERLAATGADVSGYDEISQPTPRLEPGADAAGKTANDWLAEGRSLWYADCHEEASVAFTNAIELDPKLVRAYNLRAWMYYMLDRYDEALADYATIIHMDSVEPDDLLEALEERGNLYNRMSLYAEAVADYTAAILLAPEKQNNYTARDQALARLAATGADVSGYEEMQPAPRPELEADATSKTASEWYEEGYTLWFADQYQDASVAFSKAIELEPQHVRALNLRAWMYYMLDRYEEALADYTTIITMDSVGRDDLLESLEERGNLLRTMGLYPEAIADYTTAIVLAPEKQNIYVSRGLTYEWLEQYQEAIADYDMALSLKPDDELAQIFRDGAVEKLAATGAGI